MAVRASAKRMIASLVVKRPLRSVFSALLRERASVFMLHRFADARGGTTGHRPEFLRSLLEALRRQRVPILSLRSLVDGLLEGQCLKGIVFTVDDGYHDFASVGAPVFQEFDCPVTVFLTTGFIDNLYWFWWDRVAVAVGSTRLSELPLAVLGETRRLPLASGHDRAVAIGVIREWIKRLPQNSREAAIGEVIGALQVRVPDRAPLAFRPMSWSDARRLSRAGVDFGPHSVNHPSLATLRAEQATFEVRESFKRIKQEIPEVTPVFCYPYGLVSDVGSQTARIVKAEGLAAAVTATPGYVGPESAAERFSLPRFALPDGMLDIWQIVSGFERAKALLRSPLRAAP